MYWRGDGVEQDYGEAEKWFRRAAALGHDQAMYYLGHMYEWGQGVEPDIFEAVAWYRRAAALGNFSAGDHLEELDGD